MFWHMQLYMSWYIRSFFGFTFLNILYFFKYSCTNIFHRRSLYTFYSISLKGCLRGPIIEKKAWVVLCKSIYKSEMVSCGRSCGISCCTRRTASPQPIAMPRVTARFVTRFNLWLRHDLWPQNASICDPARFVTKSASICDQRYTMILESK